MTRPETAAIDPRVFVDSFPRTTEQWIFVIRSSEVGMTEGIKRCRRELPIEATSSSRVLNSRSRSLQPRWNGADGLRIKQMVAIIVIIRIMISEREVGSLGLTGSR